MPRPSTSGVVLVVALLSCRSGDGSAAPAAGESKAVPAATAPATAGHIAPMRIRRFCVVEPPPRVPNERHPGLVWIKAVLTGTFGGKEARPLLLSLKCKWHERDDSVTRGDVAASSWECEQKEIGIDDARDSFDVVLAAEKTLGYIPAESWFGKHQIELHDREFSIDHVNTMTLPGRLVLRCPRPLAKLPPLANVFYKHPDPALTAGCEVAIENDYTHDRIASPCDGEYEVPGVFVTTDRHP